MSEESLSKSFRKKQKTTKKVKNFKKYMNFKFFENKDAFKPVLESKR